MVSRRQSVRVLENRGNSSESELHFDHWSEWQFLFRDALPSVYGPRQFRTYRYGAAAGLLAQKREDVGRDEQSRLQLPAAGRMGRDAADPRFIP